MEKMYSYFKERFDTIFLVVSVFVMLSVLVVNFLALRNNMTFADEAWYLCFLRDLPRVGASRSHLLFNKVFNNNVYAIRIACWILQLIGSLVLAIGVFSLAIDRGFKESQVSKWVLFLLALSSVYWGQTYVVACPSFNNITLNKVFAEMGIGFLLLGVSKKKMMWYLLSGFSVAFLFPTMITNVIIIPVMFVVIWLLSDRRKRDGFTFVVGILLFTVCYFVFVESPRDVLAFFVDNTRNTITRGGDDYGVKYLLLSLMHTSLYLGKCLIVAIALYGIDFVLLKKSRQRRSTSVLMAMIVSVALLLYSWMYVQPSITNFPYKHSYSYYWQMDLYWILFFMIVIQRVLGMRKMQRAEIMLSVLMLLTPICLTFGSNIPFVYRGMEYLAFISPMLVFFCIRESMLWKMALTVVLGLSMVLFFVSIDSRNWEGQKYFGNHIPVESVGIQQNVRLEQRWIDELKQCRNHVPKGRLLCSCCNWGVVYLLDYTPVCYEFSPLRDGLESFQRIIEEEMQEEGSIWVVSYSWEKDFTEALESLKDIEGYEVEMDTALITVYTHVTKRNVKTKQQLFECE